MFVNFRPSSIYITGRNYKWIRRQITYNLYDNQALSKDEINILGIETSCDDTGTAVVNGSGRVLGEGYYSQVKTSVRFGGVIPSIAQKYHEKYIEKAVHEALEKSQISIGNITAIAATVRPGNTHTLKVGSEFGKNLALQYKIPFIPIHHMEAHALTIRMEHKVDFPFLVLLVSGGHCILTLAHSIDEWFIIGESIDVAPGCAIDQVARRLRLRNIPGMADMSGGKAIEILAEGGDPTTFTFPVPMTLHKDSNFSFSGLHSFAKKLISQLEEEKGIEGGRVLEEVKDLCASFQYAVVKHMIRQTHRAFDFLEATDRIPEEGKTLVISGGVASNSFLRRSFERLCESEGYRLLVPPPKLCTDNGIMIAWNGVERWQAGKGVLYTEEEIRAVNVEHKCPLGPNISKEYRNINLNKPKWVKI